MDPNSGSISCIAKEKLFSESSANSPKSAVQTSFHWNISNKRKWKITLTPSNSDSSEVSVAHNSRTKGCIWKTRQCLKNTGHFQWFLCNKDLNLPKNTGAVRQKTVTPKKLHCKLFKRVTPSVFGSRLHGLWKDLKNSNCAKKPLKLSTCPFQKLFKSDPSLKGYWRIKSVALWKTAEASMACNSVTKHLISNEKNTFKTVIKKTKTLSKLDPCRFGCA